MHHRAKSRRERPDPDGCLLAIVAMALLFILSVSTAALGEITGQWKALTKEGVVGVEFVGCQFSPCNPDRRGDDILIDGESQDLWWLLTDGVLEIYDHSKVVATGVANSDVIQLMVGGEIYTLVKTE